MADVGWTTSKRRVPATDVAAPTWLTPMRRSTRFRGAWAGLGLGEEGAPAETTLVPAPTPGLANIPWWGWALGGLGIVGAGFLIFRRRR